MVGGVMQRGWRRAPAVVRGTGLGNGCWGGPPGLLNGRRSVRALCRWSRGQGAAEVAGGGNCREIRLPAGAVSGAKSVRAGVEAVDGGRGDTTGTKAELLRRIRWRRGPGRAARRRVATAVPCSALTERGERRLGFAGRRVSG